MSYTPSLDTLFRIGNMVFNAQPESPVMNAAANQCFLHWRQPSSKTLSQFRIQLGGVVGTPTSGLSWEIFASDANGVVGATTGVSGTVTPTSYLVMNPTGLSLALTEGNYYGVLLKNVHATPASNYWLMLAPMVHAGQIGWGMRASYDTGTTFDDSYFTIPNLQLGFSDATRYGPEALRSTLGNSGSNAVYATGGSRLGYFGGRFKPPGRVFLHKAQFAVRLNGTLASAGALSVKVFRNTTEIASVTATPGSIATSGNRQVAGNFATPLLIEPDSDYSVVLANSGGTSSHYWLTLGSSSTIIAPTGTADCIPWGLHSVQATGANLGSGWTIPANVAHYIELAFSPALRA